MIKNPVGWFEIYVQDMERAKAFYTAVFGVNFQNLSKPDVELWGFQADQESYGATGALAKMDGFTPGGNGVIVYFSCEDCSVEQAKAIDAGGKVFKKKFAIGEHGFISLITDTEGNIIGLHSFN